MRVLHVINQFSGRAGAEVSLRDIVLSTQGHELQHAVAVLRPEPNRFDGLAEAGVGVFVPHRGPRSTLGRTVHVARAISTFRPDLVHTTLFDASVAGRVAAKTARVPVLTSLVNTPYAPEALRDREVQPVAMRAVKAVDGLLSRHATTLFHAITEVVAEAAVADLGIPRGRVEVVPRGRDRARLGLPSSERRHAVRTELGIGPHDPVLINVGRQEAQKGQTYLIEAFAEVRAEHPAATLLLVGRDGNRTHAVEQRIAELNLESAVRRLGVRQDVGDLLCASDVFVFPSLYEGLGGALLEAMALRVPIVASSAPAIREVLDDGRCGTLVPVADASALAAAVTDVLYHPAGALGRVEAAERRFDRVYDLSVCLAGMTRLYADVARRARMVAPA